MKDLRFVKIDICEEINKIPGVHGSFYEFKNELKDNEIGLNLDFNCLNYRNTEKNAKILTAIQSIHKKYGFNNIDITDKNNFGFDHVIKLK